MAQSDDALLEAHRERIGEKSYHDLIALVGEAGVLKVLREEASKSRYLKWFEGRPKWLQRTIQVATWSFIICGGFIFAHLIETKYTAAKPLLFLLFLVFYLISAA